MLNPLRRRTASLKLLTPLLLGLTPCLSSAVVHAADATKYHLIRYHLIKKISVPGNDGWDYLFLDSDGRRLYISRGTHVDVVDVDKGTLVGTIPDTNGVHDVAVDPKSGRGFTSNGRSNSVTIFDLKTLKKIDEVTVGTGPDAILFDPATERVFTFNGRAQSSTVIDAVTGKVVGTIPLPGSPEAAVADGQGHVYDNLEDKSSVVAIDAKTLKIDNTWPVAPGDGPSGMAIDAKNRRLFSVCSNQKMTVMNADTGKIVATPTIGNGPDASAFDPQTQLVFSPNGRDGTVTVLREIDPDDYDVVATVPTQSGARTMALDEKTHHIFTVTAQPAPPDPNAAPGRGRGRRYVPGTFVVLEYGE